MSGEPTDGDRPVGPDGDDDVLDDAAAPIRPLSGIDMARAALSRAREEARARGVTARRRGSARARDKATGRRRDAGDPEPLGEALRRLMADRGWETPAAVVGVTERWAEIAGAELAEHCRPERFEAGLLALVAESTAWATQVRLLVPQLHRRLDEVIGRGVVDRIEVRGPTGPDWRRGPLRVRGPGPRDTYG